MRTILRQISRGLKYLAILPFLCLLLSQMDLSVHAKQLKVDDVIQAVETWVRYVTADAKPDAVIERMEPYKHDGKTVAFIAHIAGGGFCLCGQDDLVAPVYLYSPEGIFHPEDPGCQFVLSEIAARTRGLAEAARLKSSVFQRHEETGKMNWWCHLLAGVFTPMSLWTRNGSGSTQ